MQQRRRQQQPKTGPNRVRDEWEDLPLARNEPQAAKASTAAATTAAAAGKKAASPPVSAPRTQQQPKRPRQKRSPHQQTPNPPPQRKRSRSGGDSPAKAATPAATTAASRRSSKKSGAVARASSVPAGYAPAATAASTARSSRKTSVSAATPVPRNHQQQQQQQQQQQPKTKERAFCRAFSAGFCRSGAQCLDIHDGRAVEERRTAWLRGGPLPDPQPAQWGLVREAATGRISLYHASPGLAAEVPPVLVIADVGNKHKVTEFVCLALETSTGRQLGRFARFVRVPPTAPQPAAAQLVVMPSQVMTAQQALPPHQLQPFQQQQQQQQPLPQPLPQQQPFQLQPFQQAAPQPLPFPGAVVHGGATGAGNAYAPVIIEGVSNPLSSALPLPDLLQDLQQWMASLGLNPGPRDAAGFSERGNFRWVLTCGSGFPELPDLIGQHKLQLPDHLRSWTDAAKVCGIKAPKKHALPRSGLPGMLKFLGCPLSPADPRRAQRGINTVESLAQCVLSMVRLGMPLPVTSRVTQVWGGAGEYAGSRHDKFPDEPPQETVLGGAPPVVSNLLLGGAATGAAGVAPVPLGSQGGVQEAQAQQWPNGAPHGAWGGAAGAQQGQHENDAGASAVAGNGRNQRVPHWRQSVPIDLLAPDYLDFFVRERERQLYKSAAILPYRRDPLSGEVWILLGSEMRKNKLVVSCLGGKREDSDAGPEHTAWREFWEESGQVLGDHERASFLNACLEGRARAMWIQGAKMVVLACELDSPAFVSLPGWYGSGAPGIDKGNTSMLALHWVSATELHNACHQRGGRVVVWGPPPPPGPEAAAGGRPAAAGPPQPSHPNRGGGTEQEDRTPGPSRRERKLMAQQKSGASRGAGAGAGGTGGDGGEGGQGGKKARRGHRSRGGANASAPHMQPPVSSQHEQQQQQQLFSLPPPMVPISVEPYPLLKSLVADRAFQLFFAQLAAAGSSNQRFVPALNGVM
ncbi:unnamed protein product [Scytosiphon promiscuus]